MEKEMKNGSNIKLDGEVRDAFLHAKSSTSRNT
jgi:hypothetical protein